MGIFASRRTKTVDLPFDAPNTVTIRALAGRHIERAKTEFSMSTMDNVKRMGVGFQKELSAALNDDKDNEEKKQAVDAVKSDPLNGFDVDTLLKFGVVAWSYPEDVNEANIADLEAEARDFLAREVLKLSIPKLFTEAATAEKNS